MLTPEEKKQYDRHLILNEIGTTGQEQLKKARVLVIGAGGLGCPILQYLTAAGIGTIGIVDHDTVSQSNLQRQILYTHNDIGASKATVASQRLAALNPYVTFEVYTEKLSVENAITLFEKYDIIVDGTDNFPTRYLTNDAAILTGKPLVFGAIFKFEGQVSVFNYKNGPSYRCLYPKPPKPNEVPNCSQIGVLGVLPGIIGCLQANEVIKIVCGIGEVLSGKLLTYDALTMRQLVLTFQRTPAAQLKELETSYEFFCGISVAEEEITLEMLQQDTTTYNLLDVRELWEREAHHIGGQHIPLGELPARIEEVATSKPLVVYCKSGMRSQRAIALLKEHHFPTSLINLKNGLS